MTTAAQPRSTDALEDIARRLRDAYVTGPIEPLRALLDAGDGDAAYKVQALNTRFWREAGRHAVGRKVGLTAKAVQAQLGVGQPDFGVLFEDMRVRDGGTFDASRALQPRIEAEVAFVMARDVTDPQTSPESLLSAVAYASPALEIVDSRIKDWKITFADTVADNGSSGFYVLGETRRKLDGLDLYTCGMALQLNREVVSIGAGAACLGHPLNALAWLARTLALAEDGLREGDVVLSGALGPMIPLKAGDVVQADVGGLGACSVNVS